MKIRSPFEYAIRQSISEKNNDPSMMEGYETWTPEQETERRINSLKEKAASLEIKITEPGRKIRKL